MKVFNRYTAEPSGEIADTVPGDVRKFYSDNRSASDLSVLLHNARKTIDGNRNSYSQMLSSETGNPILKCREEISASVDLLDYACSLLAADPSPNQHHSSIRELQEFSVIEKTRPVRRVLSITSGINPFFRFIENFCAAVVTTSRTAVRVSSVGAGTVSAFWENLQGKEEAPVTPVFMSPDGKSMKELERSASNVVFMGEKENFLKVRKNSTQGKVSGFIRKKSYALVWEHSDPDAAAKAIVSLALAGIRDPEFAPHRVFVESDSFKYLTNRIVEETLRLRTGDPAATETDIPCMLSGGHTDAFMEAVDGEIKKWGNELTTPVREGNSVSPAVFSCSETPGNLWTEMKYGPFIITRSTDSLAEVAEAVNSDQDAGSMLVFSSDLNTMKYIENNTSLDYVLRDAPYDLSYSDIFRITDTFHSTMRMMTESGRKVEWK